MRTVGMGKQRTVSAERDEEGESLSRDSVFGLLSNRRRRLVLRYLRASGGPVAMRDLAAQVAAWENDTEPEAVTYKQRKRVYTSLYQSHLPKMRDSDVVEYDRNRGRVALTPTGSALDRYLSDDRPGRWTRAVLALAVASALFVAGVALGVEPLAAVPGIAAAGVVTGLFLLVAVVQKRRI